MTRADIILDDLLTRDGARAVSVAAAGSTAGEIVATAAGCADDAGRPVDVDTLFQAGSVSKPVAMMAALRLVASGRVDLDDDVNDHLTSWQVPPVGAWQPRITLRHLMSHTAGTTVHGFGGYRPDEPLPTTVDILDGRQPANSLPVRVERLPGVSTRYSGGGTTIAQLLVSDVTGEPFAAAAARLVLEPLGMVSSSFHQPLPAALHERSARGFAAGEQLPGGWRVMPELAAAGLWTTPSDLVRFLQGVRRTLLDPDDPFLPETVAAQVLQPYGEGTFGLGLQLEAGDRFGHAGLNLGFTARVTATRQDGPIAAVMTNSSTPGTALSDGLARAGAAVGLTGVAPNLTAAAIAKLAASLPADFVDSSGRVWTLAAGDLLGLTLSPPAQPPLALTYVRPLYFEAVGLRTSVTACVTDDALSSLVITQDGAELVALKAGTDGGPAPA